jgi:hypothetical protein
LHRVEVRPQRHEVAGGEEDRFSHSPAILSDERCVGAGLLSKPDAYPVEGFATTLGAGSIHA